jgi:diguanylate cyclase (GGDEF)-like protein/PAS domain S-box-containing protein
LLNYRKGGATFWNELRINPERDGDGKVVGYIGILTDVTERRRLSDESEELQSGLASIVENMPGYVFQRTLKTDGSLGITYFSPSFAAILGVPPGDETSVTDLWNYIHTDDIAAMRESIAQSAAKLTPLSLEFRLQTPQGGVRWVRNHSRPRRLASGEIVWDGVGLDISAEKAAEERLSYLAYHDPLTGLPNRELFAIALLKAINADAVTQDHLALLMVDLDAFQEINNAIGLSSADTILRAVAKRIADFAEVHRGFAARIGGDEFALFYALPPKAGPIPDAGGDLCRILAAPYAIAGRELLVEACVGSVTYPFDGAATRIEPPEALSELMRRATLALQAAKHVGRGMHRVYAADNDDRQHNQMILRHSLRKAIEENQFKLHYHPLVDLVSGTIIGAEALVRWNHPELGLQRPDIFIPFAESSGLIIPLGDWIFREAMQQVSSWRRAGLRIPKIAINVSGVQLQDPGLLRSIEAALAQTGTQASQFELELTEGFMIDASPSTLALLKSLKTLGFTLAIDDFGTGHSSFRYLRDFPVDKVKIDQTFVRQMVIDSSDASIIRAIIALARSLDLKVVAEGIETTVQRNFLREEGCEIGQGYLFSLPLTAEDFGYLIERDIRLPWSASVDIPASGEQKASSS